MKNSRVPLALVLAVVAVPLCSEGAVSGVQDFNAAAQELSAPSVEAWTRAGFQNVKIESFPVEQLYGNLRESHFTHGMDLTIVLFRESGWDRSEVQPRYSRVAEIYAQCGVKISSLVYVEADPYKGLSVIDNSGSRDDLTISQATPDMPHPVIYLLKHAHNQYNIAQKGYSWRNGSVHSYNPENAEVPVEDVLKNTIWLSASYKATTITTADLKKVHTFVEGVPISPSGEPYTVRLPSYSVEAHELGHILTNSGHTEGEKNFLAGSERLGNDKITPAQCEAIRRHPLVRPLR